jgi:transposase InsO family protein
MQQHLTGVPMERVSLDVLGPLPKSNDDNKFVLLVCDYFTKWVEAFPMPDQEAKTVADKFVKEFVCRYGVPRKLFTDQGSNFQSRLFKEVCELLGIEKSRTTPYHPQSDGLVERMNRTIEAMLSMFVSPTQRDWDIYICHIS